jgi:hypothetical protein
VFAIVVHVPDAGEELELEGGGGGVATVGTGAGAVAVVVGVKGAVKGPCTGSGVVPEGGLVAVDVDVEVEVCVGAEVIVGVVGDVDSVGVVVGVGVVPGVDVEVGAGASCGDITAKPSEFELPPAPALTLTCAVRVFITSDAGMLAWRRVLRTNVVGRSAPIHCTTEEPVK